MNTIKLKSGQTLIEFALLLPLFFLLVMGLFDIGRAVFFHEIMNTAVREGTRLAIVQPGCYYYSDPIACDGYFPDSYPLDCTNAQSVANINVCNEISSKLFDITDMLDSNITISHTLSSTNDPVVSIDIDFLFEPITPGLALIGDITLHVNSQMIMAPIAEP